MVIWEVPIQLAFARKLAAYWVKFVVHASFHDEATVPILLKRESSLLIRNRSETAALATACRS